MNPMLDKFMVGCVLLVGFGYATYALGPKSLRKQLLRAVVAMLGHLPDIAGARSAARRIEAASGRSASCGGCDNCGEDAVAGKFNAASEGGVASARRAVAEIKVPLSRIGKRF